MSEWKEVSIGDLGKVVTGKTPKTAIHENYGGTTPFLSPSDDMTVKHVTKTAKSLTNLGVSEVKSSLIPANSICVSCIGSDLGKVLITTEETVTNQQINSIIVNEHNDVDFVYYLMTLVGKELNHLSKSSTAVPIINKSTFSNFSVRVPNLLYQRRISSILSSLDAKIETNNRINAKLEETAQALFRSWFIDFEPFQDQPFHETELGMIPEGWRVGTLSEIAEINPKLVLKKGTVATYLDMSAMPTSGSFPKEWIKREYAGGMKFQNHDTLMARITPCLENGKVAYVDFLRNDEVGFGSTEYIVMRPKNGVLPEFFYFLCRYPDFVGYATKNMNGSSGRQRVSGETIGNYVMVIPPVEVFKKLAPTYQGIMDKIRVNGFESRRLAELRDALLPKLMNGEIEV